MVKKCFLLLFIFSSIASFSSEQLFAQKKISFSLRLGQGGFSDNRSPLGQLGGGQLALDIQPLSLPLAISISGEYYTNSPCPTHSYEIADLTAINILYMTKLSKFERVKVFLGGGFGWLEVPKSEEEPDSMVRGTLYNLEAGMKVGLFWKVGFYGVGKYLYAKKKINGSNVINFNEYILLLGLTFDFCL